MNMASQEEEDIYYNKITNNKFYNFYGVEYNMFNAINIKACKTSYIFCFCYWHYKFYMYFAIFSRSLNKVKNMNYCSVKLKHIKMFFIKNKKLFLYN